jgi:hypothetical protein
VTCDRPSRFARFWEATQPDAGRLLSSIAEVQDGPRAPPRCSLESIVAASASHAKKMSARRKAEAPLTLGSYPDRTDASEALARGGLKTTTITFSERLLPDLHGHGHD